jgi:hypothetical protein
MARPSFAWLQSFLFVACLAAPVGLTLCGLPSGRLAVEKRPMAEAPSLAMAWQAPSAYGPALAAFCRDAAPFRDHLIRAGFRLQLALFGQSPAPGVLLGREGWLYFTQESALDDYLRAIPLSEAAVRDMVRLQVERRDWLAARGMAYLVVLAPNKATVYPEFMPPGLHPLGALSRLDQVVGPLRRAGVAVLDLREALARAKARRRAYLKTDTHWNGWGAFAGAAALVAALGERYPELPPLTEADYDVETVHQPGGDLAEMLLMPDRLTEENLVPRPRGPMLARPVPAGPYADPADHPDRAGLVFETGRPDWPGAVFFHDSFTRPMVPYLAERFSRSVFLWSHAFSPEIILAERPGVVVLEVVERYVYALTLENPPEVRRDRAGP